MASSSRIARRSFAATLVLLAALIASIAAPGCSGSTAGETSPCPPGETCQTRLTLLHTADIHSRLFPYDLEITQVDSDLGLGSVGDLKTVGGAARLAYILGRERARADRVLHLDSGDCFEGAPIFNFYSGEPEMRAQSALGVDAMVIGNHEFDRGALNVARQIQSWADFPVLAANYKLNDPTQPNSSLLGTVLTPFTVFNQGGLKVAVIGMGNLSSLSSIFNQPNSLGILPMDTQETAQFYIDLLRPYVDVIVMLSHMGLEADEDMVRGTTGIDVVMGGHNHIVINPPQPIRDCSADPTNPGYVWAADPNNPIDPNNPVYDPLDTTHSHPNSFPRQCKPRQVLIMHSGAFAKYVGRLDLVLSNTPAEVTPTGDPNDYDPNNKFEVLSSKYTPFPIDDTIPEDPVTTDLLQPYQRTLDRVADLDILVGFSPTGAKRTAPQGGDSPLGNLIAQAMWLRLGVQTDFALTNTTGIRTDLNPGPITIEEMYNIFPFDNTITKMQLSGIEVEEMFDFVARRSSSRSCVSQAQIAGARVRINCAGCTRPDATGPCRSDSDCPSGGIGDCNVAAGMCQPQACAEQIYIGQMTDASGNAISCMSDADCGNGSVAGSPGQCDLYQNGQLGTSGTCQQLISPTNLYELATSNYLAAGGSGFQVLQRNTTQFDTLIQQRDATIDYLRNGNPCGYDTGFGTAEGLKACSVDTDCADQGDFVCACASHSNYVTSGGASSCQTDSMGCDPSEGRCVRRDCRDQVAQFHATACADSQSLQMCQTDLAPCSLAGEECKIISCVDTSLGNFTDNRLEMIGR